MLGVMLNNLTFSGFGGNAIIIMHEGLQCCDHQFRMLTHQGSRSASPSKPQALVVRFCLWYVIVSNVRANEERNTQLPCHDNAVPQLHTPRL
jgi:hypothetical protein